jgi:hypothetical protein
MCHRAHSDIQLQNRKVALWKQSYLLRKASNFIKPAKLQIQTNSMPELNASNSKQQNTVACKYQFGAM